MRERGRERNRERDEESRDGARGMRRDGGGEREEMKRAR